MFISVIITISSVIGTRHNFDLKQRQNKTKTPTLGDLALANLPLEDSKVNTLAKGREG